MDPAGQRGRGGKHRAGGPMSDGLSSSSSSSSLVELLGVRKLSEVVLERIRAGFTPPLVGPPPPVIARWNRSLQSVALRNGLRQIISSEGGDISSSSFSAAGSFFHRRREEGSSSGAAAIAAEKEEGDRGGGAAARMDMVTRLCELENVEIVACRALEVSFFVDGRDVTAPAGLAALQQQIGKTHDGAVGNGVVDVRGGAFGSEVVLVGHREDDALFSKPPRQRRHVPQDTLLLAEASGRRTLFLDVELTAPNLWVYFVADALKRGVLGGEYPKDR